MKRIEWNLDKNQWLKQYRNICFEDIVAIISGRDYIDDIDNPNQEKYGGQKMYIVYLNAYIYMIPYVEDEEKVFLKTIIPTRKLKRKYLKSQI